MTLNRKPLCYAIEDAEQHAMELGATLEEVRAKRKAAK